MRSLKSSLNFSWRTLKEQNLASVDSANFAKRFIQSSPMKKLIIFVFALFLIGMVSGEGVISSANYQPQASFQSVYGPDDRLNTYWPILGNKDQCLARQDVMLQVSPGGCQPTVVRSDLLAEQNVPVFCQIDALQINPLIDIEQIRGITFTSKYPKDVIGAGFYPARSALNSRDKLLGSPLINNIGYVVLILKRNEVEKNVPNFVSVNLTGRIQYEAGNAFGVGKAEFTLEPMSDAQWEKNRFRQSFWEGRYFVRLEQADSNFATISLYSGNIRIATQKVEKGKESSPIWVPGAYCRAGVTIAYDGFVGDKDKGLIELSDGDGTDRVEVYLGSKLLNDKCSVTDIQVRNDSTGSVTISCGSDKKVLRIGNYEGNQTGNLYLSGEYEKGKFYRVYYDNAKTITSSFTLDASTVLLNGQSVGGIENGIISIDRGNFDKYAKISDKVSYDQLNGAKIEEGVLVLNGNLGTGGIVDKVLGGDKDANFEDAIKSLESVADSYPAEREADAEGAQVYGEQALKRAIELAKNSGKEATKARLIKKLIDSYPNNGDFYSEQLNQLQSYDLAGAGGVIKLDNKFWNVRLVRLDKPVKKSSASFAITGNVENVKVDAEQSLSLGQTEGYLAEIKLDKIQDENNVLITPSCFKDGKVAKGSQISLRTGGDATNVCDKSSIRLRDVDLQQIAKVRLLPQAQGTVTETNLSITVGIEKRAIKLSPSKTEEMISNLNESIKKWENINSKLGKVVEGLKGACFATSAVLIAKNFLTGISGESLARQNVMGGEYGWTKKCADLVARGDPSAPTLNACYLNHADEINGDVSATEDQIKQINTKIEGIEKNAIEQGTGILGTGSSVNREKAAVEYCKSLIDGGYGDTKVDTTQGSKSLKELIGGDSSHCENAYKNGVYGYNELRDIELNLKLKQVGGSDVLKSKADGDLKSSYNNILQNSQRYAEVQKLVALRDVGIPQPMQFEANNRKDIIGQVLPKSGVKDKALSDQLKSDYVASSNVPSTSGNIVGNSPEKGIAGGNYILGLTKNTAGSYDVQEVYKVEGNGGYTKLGDAEAMAFERNYGVGRIVSAESQSYLNPYKNPDVKYYETDPYKGMPAIVPFDTREGWYAATRQTLPSFGGISSFDASGRVTSFYLCNVGLNGQEQFFEGYGDDICQLINLNTGQPLGFFPGLDDRTARQRVSQAIQAIQDASNQYARIQGQGQGRIVRIGGKDYTVGSPAANIPATQCQNFMSPQECQLLFNVCDPVICPSSRCDFGGKYPVADVVQTGIIGSTLLCLPNIREKIVIPVCLTGIHAGIEGFVSILRNHRDCLQESLVSGKTIGICDQIYSVYLCEFFWRQIAPIAKVILPKIVELAYGQGTRGGGEYLTTMAAWQNMQNSISYFTQSYAANSIKAFNARSIEEVGTPICKAFISAKAPTSFKTLIEPDSPSQFHAWFSATKYSDVTVPATSQYKVFYHIFAGNDQGVYFSVYLRNPPESSYYALPAIISVASGFAGKGQYATESKDFTAPEGYKELCVRVNDKEECGFGQISTSFAVNSLSDSYASSQVGQNDIKGESECISGSPNLGAALTTPNIQSGLEASALPRDYNRGIVRICSSDNPGSQTDPTRFVEVGYCDDQKIKCWMDKNSVKNAISDNNKGVLNATLSDLEEKQNAQLEKQGLIVGNDQATAQIKVLKDDVGKVKNAQSIDSTSYDNLLGRLNSLLGKLVLNHHKANVLLLIGELKAEAVSKVVRVEAAKQSAPASTGTGIPSGTEGSSGSTSAISSYRTASLIFDYGYANNDQLDVRWSSALNKAEVKVYVNFETLYNSITLGNYVSPWTSDQKDLDDSAVKNDVYPEDITLMKSILSSSSSSELSSNVRRAINSGRSSFMVSVVGSRAGDGRHDVTLEEVNLKLYGANGASGTAATTPTVPAAQGGFSLINPYDSTSSAKNYLYYNGKITKFYLTKISLQLEGSQNTFGAIEVTASISRFRLFTSHRDDFNAEMTKEIGNNINYYDSLDLSEIKGTGISK